LPDLSGKFNISFELSNFENIKSLRFDPIENDFCRVKIDTIKIKRTKREEVIEFNRFVDKTFSNGIITENGVIEFYTSDPQIFLPLCGDIECLNIIGEINIVDKYSISNFIDSTRSELDSTRSELDSTRSELDSTRSELDSTRSELDKTLDELVSIMVSKSWKLTRPIRRVVKKIFKKR